MSPDTERVPRAHPMQSYGMPETIAHWRRQAEMTDSDVESATFLHCADEAAEIWGAQAGPPPLHVERLARALNVVAGTGVKNRNRDFAERLSHEYARLAAAPESSEDQ